MADYALSTHVPSRFLTINVTWIMGLIIPQCDTTCRLCAPVSCSLDILFCSAQCPPNKHCQYSFPFSVLSWFSPYSTLYIQTHILKLQSTVELASIISHTMAESSSLKELTGGDDDIIKQGDHENKVARGEIIEIDDESEDDDNEGC